MSENGRRLTSEELIKYIQITINNSGPYALLEELSIENRDEIFAKIKAVLHSSSKEEKVQSIDSASSVESVGVSQEKNIDATEYRDQSSFSTEVDSASIYAKEHLEAVQDDLLTHNVPIHQGKDLDSSLSQPKVLEKRIPPVNFVGCETVEPGQFKK